MHRLDFFLHPRVVFGFLIDNEIKGSLVIRLSLFLMTLQYEYFDPHTGAEPYEDL